MRSRHSSVASAPPSKKRRSWCCASRTTQPTPSRGARGPDARTIGASQIDGAPVRPERRFALTCRASRRGPSGLWGRSAWPSGGDPQPSTANVDLVGGKATVGVAAVAAADRHLGNGRSIPLASRRVDAHGGLSSHSRFPLCDARRGPRFSERRATRSDKTAP